MNALKAASVCELRGGFYYQRYRLKSSKHWTCYKLSV